jgi:hypothetical protein
VRWQDIPLLDIFVKEFAAQLSPSIVGELKFAIKEVQEDFDVVTRKVRASCPDAKEEDVFRAFLVFKLCACALSVNKALEACQRINSNVENLHAWARGVDDYVRSLDPGEVSGGEQGDNAARPGPNDVAGG